MRKSFIVRVDERNHRLFSKSFNVAYSMVDLPSDENLKGAKIERISADVEDQSANDYELYRITFANGFVEYYALEIPYNRAARTIVETDRIVISIMNFGEQGFYSDQFDFMISEYTGVESETREDFKQFLYDVCRDQLDSAFGLLDDADYNTIFDAIDDWVDKYISESEFAS